MIVAHSPTRQPSCELPNRIVIRDLGDQFVVHTEILEPGRNPAYHCGHYFPKRVGEDAALAGAWKKFEGRSRRLLAVPPDPDIQAVLREFVRAIGDAGGLGWNPEERAYGPVGDPGWTDLAVTYRKACEALGVEPVYESTEEDKDEEKSDDEKINRARWEGQRREIETRGSEPGDDPDNVGN